LKVSRRSDAHVNQQSNNRPARRKENPAVEIPQRYNLECRTDRFGVVQIAIYRNHLKAICTGCVEGMVEGRQFGNPLVYLGLVSVVEETQPILPFLWQGLEVNGVVGNRGSRASGKSWQSGEI